MNLVFTGVQCCRPRQFLVLVGIHDVFDRRWWRVEEAYYFEVFTSHRRRVNLKKQRHEGLLN